MNIIQYFWSTLIIYYFTAFDGSIATNSQPHIIVIIADDVGWNDVGFHGSNEIPTPNIDALAYGGVILNRHYALPTCTPSRASFLTGRYAIRMGLQGIPINVAEPRGIPLREKLLPEYLRDLGYVTRLVGKWHLGYYTDNHTPTRRGFDSFAGYYGGVITYFNHTTTKKKHTGIDFHRDTPKSINPLRNNQYVTDFITDEAQDIIENHDKKKPLYLQLSHLAGHSSENWDPLEVNEMSEINNTLNYIPDLNRRKYAGIITAMDNSIGKVIKALQDTDMLSNSIIIFLSDNGAASAGSIYRNHGSNYPFRGDKSTLYEGGIRVPACVFSPLLKDRFRISNEFFHITDWFPTLYKLAGGDLSDIHDLDGIDQWPVISNSKKTKRKSFLANIDEIFKMKSAIYNNYKLIVGKQFRNDYVGTNGNIYSPKTYNVTRIVSSLAGSAILSLGDQSMPSQKKIMKLRKEATVKCQMKDNHPNCSNACLFDIVKDPCETTNVINQYPQVKNVLNRYIRGFEAVMTNQTNTYLDPAGFPENVNDFWMPWMTEEHTPPKNRNISGIWQTDVFCEGYPIDDPRNCL